MGQIYDLLAINDSSSRQMDLLRRRKSDDSYVIDIDWGGHAYLRGQLKGLISSGYQFHNCVFTTHGSPGAIWLGDQYINREVWYTEFYNGPYGKLFPFPNTKLYFAGCNVADGDKGWRFLTAAARSLLGVAGGTAMGWTSLGFGLGPIHSGHVAHLWGDTREVSVLAGGDYLRYYENWKLIADGQGNPASPI